METLNGPIIDIEEKDIISVKNDNPDCIEQRQDGYYCWIPVYTSLPNQEIDFHAGLLLPLVLNCINHPLYFNDNEELINIGQLTDILSINREEGVLAIEAKIEESYVDLFTEELIINLDADVPDEAMDSNCEYTHKDLVDMVRIEKVVMERK